MVTFIELTGPEHIYLIRVDLIESIECAEAADGNFDSWVETVITYTVGTRTIQYMCQESVEEIIEKLNSIKDEKIRII